MSDFPETQEKKDEKYKVEPLKFTEHYSGVEKSEGFQQGYLDHDILRQKDKEAIVQIGVTKQKYDKELQFELNKLKKLEPGQELKLKSGTIIKYREKKKWAGIKRKETDAEYRERVGMALKNTFAEKAVSESAGEHLTKQYVDYYGNSDIVNKVDERHVSESFSEKRKMILKRSITAMAKMDVNKNFYLPEDLKDDKLTEEEKKRKRAQEAFTAFLDAVIAYGSHDVKMKRLITTVDQVYKDKKTKEIKKGRSSFHVRMNDTKAKEQKLFVEMKDKLEKAREACGYDRNLVQTLDGYDNLFSTIADGNLKIPKEPDLVVMPGMITDGGKIINSKGEIVDKKGQVVNKQEVEDNKKIPLFAHEPSENDVIQGRLGDCYLVASLSGIVSAEPQIIKNAIKDNGDGTCTVKLYRPGITESKPVYIKVPKLQPKNHAAKNALWVNMFELAYTEYLSQLKAREDAIDQYCADLHNTYDYPILTGKLKELYRKVEKDAQDHFKGANILDLGEAIRWEYVQKAEEYIRDSMDDFKYNILLEKRLYKPRNTETIEGGLTTNFISVLTGLKQNTDNIHKVNGEIPEELNKLSYVYNDVMENVIKKSKGKTYAGISDEEAHIETVAEYIVKKHIDKYTCKENHWTWKDKKGKDHDEYSGMMSRAQLEKLAKRAQKDLQGDDTIAVLLSGLEDKSVAKVYNELKADPKVADKIGKAARALMDEFVSNQDRNTVLNYERFSGNYTDRAISIYNEIEKAAGEHKIMTAGTIKFSRKNCEKEASGEPVFGGIASTHAYSVVGVKEVREKEDNGAEKITRFVRVRNPWGHYHTVYEKNAQGKIEMKDSTNAVTEGINEIELNDFMERFRGVTYTDPVAIMEKQRIEAEAVRKEEQEEKKRIALEETRKITQEEVKGEQ